ncbi:General transcription factor II-I repeat domain-containing protein 2A [Eumeta japonica]|uniref:General transcription factor II-I repeat domain-containing protein 2A n=1 Tax=Eumeta variegata TaxID=151549 RepID=A0A4C1Y5F0_EUMVA|nr:General transcription factor II-I repeat domain-containing protein 2A [Eumeta japonica]
MAETVHFQVNFDKRYPSELLVPSICFETWVHLDYQNVYERMQSHQFQQNGQLFMLNNVLDESTDLSDTAQLAIFIRGVNKKFSVTKELFALQPLKGTTTKEDIFNEVQKGHPDHFSVSDPGPESIPHFIPAMLLILIPVSHSASTPAFDSVPRLFQFRYPIGHGSKFVKSRAKY